MVQMKVQTVNDSKLINLRDLQLRLRIESLVKVQAAKSILYSDSTLGRKTVVL